MIKYFGPTTRHWLMDILDNCRKQLQIPNIMAKTKVVALLMKPVKDTETPKSYRPVALLWSLYRLLEGMILTRLQWSQHKLVPQQAGFRPGKSCAYKCSTSSSMQRTASNLVRSLAQLSVTSQQHIIPPTTVNFWLNSLG